jgi:ketosteroid isomerase-like protein
VREQIVAFPKKFDDACNKNDATALAALYREDAVIVTNTGQINGREAIEKYYADLLQSVHFSDHLGKPDQSSPHRLGTAGTEVWRPRGNGVRPLKPELSALY